MRISGPHHESNKYFINRKKGSWYKYQGKVHIPNMIEERIWDLIPHQWCLLILLILCVIFWTVWHLILLILLQLINCLLIQFVLLIIQKLSIILPTIIVKVIHILDMEMPPQKSKPYFCHANSIYDFILSHVSFTPAVSLQRKPHSIKIINHSSNIIRKHKLKISWMWFYFSYVQVLFVPEVFLSVLVSYIYHRSDKIM